MIGCQLDIVKVHTINALFCCEALMVSIETTGHRGYSAAIAHSCPTVVAPVAVALSCVCTTSPAQTTGRIPSKHLCVESR